MDNLIERMNTGIRAACGSYTNIILRYFGQRRFKLILYCASIRLTLPTAIIATIVFQYQYDSHNSLRLICIVNAIIRMKYLKNQYDYDQQL